MAINGVLIIIDVQNDFCKDGSLPVAEAEKIIPSINRISSKFQKVIVTQDWHPENHVSFAKTHNMNVYDVIDINGIKQKLWPVHCVPGTWGAELHKDLDMRNVDMIIRTGSNPKVDSYSAFLENDMKTETGLRYYLKGLKIKDVYLCGLATDYCVYYTAKDSTRYGFNTYVILDATRGINKPPGSIKKSVDNMVDKGVKIIGYESI